MLPLKNFLFFCLLNKYIYKLKLTIAFNNTISKFHETAFCSEWNSFIGFFIILIHSKLSLIDSWVPNRKAFYFLQISKILV